MNPIIASLHLFTGPRDALNFYNLSSLEIGINLFRSKTHFRSVCFRPEIVCDHLIANLRGLGGVVVIDAAIGAHGRDSRLAHYFTVAATLDKSLTSHCL